MIQEGFDKRVYRLLNSPRHAQYQWPDGNYGKRTRIGLRHFELHLAGTDSIAVSAVDGGKVNFLAIDVDKEFLRRLPIFRDVLARRGLDGASFGITGSGPGRGKIVVCLRNRLLQRQAQRLVQHIIADAINDERFGSFDRKDATPFPQGEGGGHVRLFGRNRRRVYGHVLREAPIDLNGDLSDLYQVEPADVAAEAERRTPNRPVLSASAQRFMDEPYMGSTTELFKAQVRLAREFVRLHGKASAPGHLAEAFRSIEEQSPELSASSRRNLLRADTVARVVKYATSSRLANGNYNSIRDIWLPMGAVKAPRPAVRVYEALADYVLAEGLDPNCFGIDYGRIGDLAGYAGKGKAFVATRAAIIAGLIVQLDRGAPKQNGHHGLCALYALVGNHNNPAEALAAGIETSMYLARREERKRLGLSPAIQDALGRSESDSPKEASSVKSRRSTERERPNRSSSRRPGRNAIRDC